MASSSAHSTPYTHPSATTLNAEKQPVSGNENGGSTNRSQHKREVRPVPLNPLALRASALPDGFPAELAYRALAAYSLLRTLSWKLRLSPFTPNVFLRALALPYPNRLLGQIHVCLLRILLPTLDLGYSYRQCGRHLVKRKRIAEHDGVRQIPVQLAAGDNLTYLDGLSWPLFFDDYARLTEFDLSSATKESGLSVDFRNIVLRRALASDTANEEEEEQEDQQPGVIIADDSNGKGTVVTDEKDQNVRKGRGRGRGLPLTRPRRNARISPRRTSQELDNVEWSGSENETETESDESDYEEQGTRSRSRKRKRGRQKKPRRRANKPQPQPESQPESSPGSRVIEVTTPPVSDLPSAFSKSFAGVSQRVTTVPLSSQSMAVELAAAIHTCRAATSFPGHSIHAPFAGVSASTATHYPVAPSQPPDLAKAASDQRCVSLPFASDVGGNLTPYPGNATYFQTALPQQLPVMRSLSDMSNLPVQGTYMTPFRPLGQEAQLRIPALPSRSVPKPESSKLNSPSNPNSIADELRSFMRGKARAASKTPAAELSGQKNTPTPPDESAILQEGAATSKASVLQGPEAEASRVSPNLSQENQPPVEMKPSSEKSSPVKVASSLLEQGTIDDQADTADEPMVKENELEDDASVKSNDGESDSEAWPHFKPLKEMRGGRSYHRLSAEHKLDILEFLLDEILAVDFIAIEFNRRQIITDCYGFPYGVLPTSSELESLENEDNCGVCELEGELLCCDGCTASYHRHCINVASAAQIPEGTWLCAECKLKDPALFGPLRAGRKASLDWFTLEDLLRASEHQAPSGDSPSVESQGPRFGFGTEKDAAALSMEVSGTPLEKGQTPVSDGYSVVALANGVSEETLHTVQGSGSSKALGTYQPVDGLPDEKLTTNAEILSNPVIDRDFKDLEFLIVHGFVFCRQRAKDEMIKEDMISENKSIYRKCDIASIEQKPVLPMSTEELSTFLAKLGGRLSKSWPLVQIPTPVRSAACSQHQVSYDQFYAWAESFDPNLYSSRYRHAPYPRSAKHRCVGSQLQHLVQSEYETECAFNNTRKLSSTLSSDMSSDSLVSKRLTTSTEMYNPYNLFSSYLLKLEERLKNSYLIRETWGTSGKNGRTWSSNVSQCRSVKRLARLLVKLVDSANSRVFVKDWFRNANNSPGKDEDTDTFTYLPLPWDWTPELELKKRSLEQLTSLDRISYSRLRAILGADESSHSFGGVETVTRLSGSSNAGSRKRKNSKPQVKPFYSNPAATGDQNLRQSSTQVPPQQGLTEGHAGSSPNNSTLSLSSDKREKDEHPVLPSTSSVIPSSSSSALSAVSSSKGEKVEHSVPPSSTSAIPSSLTRANSTVMPKVLPEYVSEKGEKIEHPISPSNLSGAPVPLNESGPLLSYNGEDVERSIPPSKSSTIPHPLSSNANYMHRYCDDEESSAKPLGREDILPEAKGCLEDSSVRAKVDSSSAVYQDSHHSVQPQRSDSDVVKVSESTEAVPHSDVGGAPTKGRKGFEEAEVNGNDTGKRKRSRRSGRLRSRVEPYGRMRSVAQEALARSESEGNKDVGIESLIAAEKEAKMQMLEDMTRLPFEKEIHWPLAGRSLFEPTGSLSPFEMKRLGRNGGMVVAPFLTYNSLFEVGQAAVCHVWRKATLQSDSFEKLLLQIRVLESFIDKSAISACESLARRGSATKSQQQKVIRCVQRDIGTGTNHYFVVNKRKRRGCWVPEENVDLSAFVLERGARRDALLDRVRRKMSATSKVKPNKQNIAATKPPTNTVYNATSSAPTSSIGRPYQPDPKSVVESIEASRRHTDCKPERSAIESTIMNHQLQTEQLLLKYTELRRDVPAAEMDTIRAKHLKQLKHAVAGGEGKPLVGSSQLLPLLIKAEETANLRFQSYLAQLRSQDYQRQAERLYGGSSMMLANSNMNQGYNMVDPGSGMSLPNNHHLLRYMTTHAGGNEYQPWQQHSNSQLDAQNTNALLAASASLQSQSLLSRGQHDLSSEDGRSLQPMLDPASNYTGGVPVGAGGHQIQALRQARLESLQTMPSQYANCLNLPTSSLDQLNVLAARNTLGAGGGVQSRLSGLHQNPYLQPDLLTGNMNRHFGGVIANGQVSNVASVNQSSQNIESMSAMDLEPRPLEEMSKDSYT